MIANISRILIFFGIVAGYCFVFNIQENKNTYKDVTLRFVLPVSFFKFSTGYFRQLVAEVLFIRTSVFLGGVRPGIKPVSYENALANNFEVMTQLYPRFIDPYYFCQGFLTSISQESAARASAIFETGIAAHPNDLVLRFFYGANFFLTMNEPLKGAKAFSEAAQLEKAPPMFGHLASLLSAQGGDIKAGLVSLQTLLKTEKNEVVRVRYEEEITIFNQALTVQEALNAYSFKYGVAPESLEQLVPEFIQSIPVIKDSFQLVYVRPNLHLSRPTRKFSFLGK